MCGDIGTSHLPAQAVGAILMDCRPQHTVTEKCPVIKISGQSVPYQIMAFNELRPINLDLYLAFYIGIGIGLAVGACNHNDAANRGDKKSLNWFHLAISLSDISPFGRPRTLRGSYRQPV